MTNESAWHLHDIVTAVPPQSLTPEQSAEQMQLAYTDDRIAKRVRRMMRLAGIKRRYLAALDHQDPAAPLFQPAGVQPSGPGMGARGDAFLVSAGKLMRELTGKLPADSLAALGALITVSCTHASSPGIERPLLTQSAIPPNVSRWHLGFMGCSAGLAALRLIHSLQLPATALAVTCELSSLQFQYSDDPEQMTANMLFADGAAAVYASRSPGPIRIVAAESIALVETADQMRWWADNHGLKLALSPELPDTLGKHLPAAVDAFLDRAGATRADIKHWLIHPGGPQILAAAAESLGLPDNALDLSIQTLREFGNMSSSTILFIIGAHRAAQTRGRALAAAFGPGLTIELVLLDFC